MNFISSSRKFEFVGTIDTQMKSFAELRSTNPDKAKAIFENGMKLVEHAKAGEFRKFRMIVDNGEEGDFLVYFVSQMMLASLVSGHLMITQYIIDQGYPINNYHIPSSLHQCLELTEDANGVAVVEFLSAKKIDVNRQEQQSWLTPLHIAVRYVSAFEDIICTYLFLLKVNLLFFFIVAAPLFKLFALSYIMVQMLMLWPKYVFPNAISM